MSGIERNAVVQRLDRLERENRLLKRAGAVVLAVALTVALTAQTGRKILVAEAFVLRDAQGVVHGVLDVTSTGTARLRLGTSDATSVAQLEAAPTGHASLSLSGNYQASAPTVRLDVSRDDFTGLYVELGGASEGMSLGGGSGQAAAVEWSQLDTPGGARVRLSSPNVQNLLRSELTQLPVVGQR